MCTACTAEAEGLGGLELQLLLDELVEVHYRTAGYESWRHDSVAQAKNSHLRELARDAHDREGLALLRASLTPDQLDSFEKNKSFDLVGSKGGRFRIFCHAGWAGNVADLDQHALLCAAPRTGASAAQFFLGQKLCIEADENLFHRKAMYTSNYYG